MLFARGVFDKTAADGTPIKETLMGRTRFILVAALAVALAGCGVPRATLQLAQQQAALSTANLTDADVATALRNQADQWAQLSTMLQQRQLGGILLVDARFVELAASTAASAARLRAQMDAGTDDPALRRDLLAAYQALWSQAEAYLK